MARVRKWPTPPGRRVGPPRGCCRPQGRAGPRGGAARLPVAAPPRRAAGRLSRAAGRLDVGPASPRGGTAQKLLPCPAAASTCSIASSCMVVPARFAPSPVCAVVRNRWLGCACVLEAAAWRGRLGARALLQACCCKHAKCWCAVLNFMSCGGLRLMHSACSAMRCARSRAAVYRAVSYFSSCVLCRAHLLS